MDIEKKYELILSDKEGLYRIKALKCFGCVMIGEIGGYVECEKNLSQYGDCWIYCDAVVRDNARVEDNAKVWGKAVVRDNAIVCGYAEVSGCAVVYNNAQIWDNAQIYDKAVVQSDVVIKGNAEVCADAIISSDRDYIVFKNWWSSGRYFTWTRSNNKWKVGCFYGTSEELITKAYKDSEEKGREYEKIVKYVEGVNKPYTQTLEKTWKYKIYLKLLNLKTIIVKLLR